jgi:hypothetical protein
VRIEENSLSFSRSVLSNQMADDINPLVDEVVQSMYPPLDARVLVSQAAELVSSAKNLAELVVGGGSASSAQQGSSSGNGGSSNSTSSLGAPNESSSLVAGSGGVFRRRHRQVSRLVAGAERSLQVRSITFVILGFFFCAVEPRLRHRL